VKLVITKWDKNFTRCKHSKHADNLATATCLLHDAVLATSGTHHYLQLLQRFPLHYIVTVAGYKMCAYQLLAIVINNLQLSYIMPQTEHDESTDVNIRCIMQ
jgi:hypothetical protein